MYEKELKRYCSKAVSGLVCGQAEREKLRQYIFASAQDYLEEQPNTTFEELQAVLGSPEEIAQEFMCNQSPKEVQHWHKKHRQKMMIGVITTALVIVVLAGLVIGYYCVKGVFTVKTTIVQYNAGEDFDVLAAPTAAPI